MTTLTPCHFTAGDNRVPKEVTAAPQRTDMCPQAILFALGTSTCEPKESLSCCSVAAGAEAGRQREGEELSLCTERLTHTHRLWLTCLQLEVVGWKGLPGQGQGHHRLQMWHMLLHVCCGIANTVCKKPFNYSCWHKNQSPLGNVVTNC